MSLLSPVASDDLFFTLAPAATDLLDIGQVIVPTQIGLRCGTVRCGTSRCGFGGTFIIVPGDPFFDAVGSDDL